MEAVWQGFPECPRRRCKQMLRCTIAYGRPMQRPVHCVQGRLPTPNPRPTSMRLKATKDAAHPLDLMDVSAPSRDVSLDARALGSFAAKLAPEPSQKDKSHMFAFGIAYSVTAVLGKYARRTYFDKKDWVCAGTGLLAASGTAMALPLLSAGVAPTAGWALGLFLASMAMLSAESARVRPALSTALAVMGRIGHYLLCGVDGARGE
jgi:hypothetical protein